jgi:hypothetical protein
VKIHLVLVYIKKKEHTTHLMVVNNVSVIVNRKVYHPANLKVDHLGGKNGHP